MTFLLENLNTQVDDYSTPFARAEDRLALVATVDHPDLKLIPDLNHAQMAEGNLIGLVRHCLPWIGEIQFTDIPSRREPGTGEINYGRVARCLAEIEYHGPIGPEAWPGDDSDVALERFQSVFSA